MSSPRFNKGQRVTLPANRKEGWPEERGFIEEVEAAPHEGMYIVRVDEKFRSRGDDGIREVHESGIQDSGTVKK